MDKKLYHPDDLILDDDFIVNDAENKNFIAKFFLKSEHTYNLHPDDIILTPIEIIDNNSDNIFFDNINTYETDTYASNEHLDYQNTYFDDILSGRSDKSTNKFLENELNNTQNNNKKYLFKEDTIYDFIELESYKLAGFLCDNIQGTFFINTKKRIKIILHSLIENTVAPNFNLKIKICRNIIEIKRLKDEFNDLSVQDIEDIFEFKNIIAEEYLLRSEKQFKKNRSSSNWYFKKCSLSIKRCYKILQLDYINSCLERAIYYIETFWYEEWLLINKYDYKYYVDYIKSKIEEKEIYKHYDDTQSSRYNNDKLSLYLKKLSRNDLFPNILINQDALPIFINQNGMIWNDPDIYNKKSTQNSISEESEA